MSPTEIMDGAYADFVKVITTSYIDQQMVALPGDDLAAIDRRMMQGLSDARTRRSAANPDVGPGNPMSDVNALAAGFEAKLKDIFTRYMNGGFGAAEMRAGIAAATAGRDRGLTVLRGLPV